MSDNGNVPARVMALYGQPGFESWRKIAKVLRVPPRTAWNMARGRCHANQRTLGYLECAEWRLACLPQATANLAALLGQRPVRPVVFARHANRHKRKESDGSET